MFFVKLEFCEKVYLYSQHEYLTVIFDAGIFDGNICRFWGIINEPVHIITSTLGTGPCKTTFLKKIVH